MCTPYEENHQFIIGNDVSYENDGPSDSNTWEYSKCDEIIIDGDGECIQHIDSLFYDKDGLIGWAYSTNKGNSGHLNQ